MSGPCRRITCSHGCSFSLVECPETCPHGVGLFGSWARLIEAVNEAIRSGEPINRGPELTHPPGVGE